MYLRLYYGRSYAPVHNAYPGEPLEISTTLLKQQPSGKSNAAAVDD